MTVTDTYRKIAEIIEKLNANPRNTFGQHEFDYEVEYLLYELLEEENSIILEVYNDSDPFTGEALQKLEQALQIHFSPLAEALR